MASTQLKVNADMQRRAEWASLTLTRGAPSGLGVALWGGVLVSAAWLDSISVTYGRLLVVVAAPLWYLANAVTSRRYRRVREVIATEAEHLYARRTAGESLSARPHETIAWVSMGIVGALLLLVRGVGPFEAPPFPAAAGYVVVVLSIIITVALAWLHRGSGLHGVAPLMLLYVAGMENVTKVLVGAHAPVFALMGLLMVLEGSRRTHEIGPPRTGILQAIRVERSVDD